MAQHNYHDSYKIFTWGTKFDDPANIRPNRPWTPGDHRKGSILTKLLPYIEQSPLYDQLDFRGDVFAQLSSPALRYGSGGGLIHNQLETLRCPSDDYVPNHTLSNYAKCIGFQPMPSRGCYDYQPPAVAYYHTGLRGHGSNASATSISGCFARWHWAAKMRDITDGTSNTILMGEIRPFCGDHSHGGAFNPNALWTATTAPINYPTCLDQLGGTRSGAFTCNHWANWQTSLGFKSRHPGGAQFLFADGSAHFLAESLDYYTYQRLGDRWDNLPVGKF